MEIEDLKMPIKVDPYQHQEKAFKFVMSKFENLGGSALLIEMGCGKSLISVAIARTLFEESKIRKLLVAFSLSIYGVWEEEFSKFSEFNYDLKILKGTSDSKAKMLNSVNGNSLQVAVVNYEYVWRIQSQIKNLIPDMIICDESHKIKTHNIVASESLHMLGEKAGHKLILTGTFIMNKAIDAFSQYKFLDPRIFGKSFYAFRNRYFDMVWFGNYAPILKKSMELKEKIHSVAFRATIELESNAMNIYKHLARYSFAELSRGEVTATNILTKILRVSQLTGGFLGDD